jgi:hypothetical protein
MSRQGEKTTRQQHRNSDGSWLLSLFPGMRHGGVRNIYDTPPQLCCTLCDTMMVLTTSPSPSIPFRLRLSILTAVNLSWYTHPLPLSRSSQIVHCIPIAQSQISSSDMVVVRLHVIYYMRSFLLVRRWPVQLGYPLGTACRCNGFHTYPLHHEGQTTLPTFESLGLRPNIVTALHAAFPNVKRPTEMQAQLIRTVISGDDVLLKDQTGTGKYVSTS